MVGKSIRSRISGIPVTRFNRYCLLFTFFWLSLTVPFGLLIRPTSLNDFSQFYMGGVIARESVWQALYPYPLPKGLDNPGLSIHSYADPKWNAIRKYHKVPDDTRFILPPPSAAVFVPLSYFSFETAYWIWISFLTSCVWGVGLLSGRIYRHIVGRPSHLEGALALLIVFSPMTIRSIRIANVSPPVALLLGVTILSLFKMERPFRGAGAMLFGALLKYATMVLVPLVLATRQWRMIAWLITLGLFTVFGTLFVSGVEPFLDFAERIMPTLSRPSSYRGNQSLPGLLSRVFGRPLPDTVSHGLTILRLGVLAMVVFVLFRIRPSHWKNPINVLAGATALLAWLLAFSPISWEHWPVFLCPVWGWMIWEAKQSRSMAAIATTSLALMYVPAGIFQMEGFLKFSLFLPEPFNTWQLFGVLLAWVVAVRRLLSTCAHAHSTPHS